MNNVVLMCAQSLYTVLYKFIVMLMNQFETLSYVAFSAKE